MRKNKCANFTEADYNLYYRSPITIYITNIGKLVRNRSTITVGVLGNSSLRGEINLEKLRNNKLNNNDCWDNFFLHLF